MTYQRENRRQLGFTLIEVLVTLVVVSFGLLGFAGLQVSSLQNNRIGMQRSLATLHAYNIVDCMRANRVQALASNYNQSYGATAVAGTVAGDDLTNWNATLARDLVSGQGTITVIGNNVQISVRWKEGVESSNPYITWSTQTTL